MTTTISENAFARCGGSLTTRSPLESVEVSLARTFSFSDWYDWMCLCSADRSQPGLGQWNGFGGLELVIGEVVRDFFEAVAKCEETDLTTTSSDKSSFRLRE